jgi:hypothetical protein
LEPEPDPHHVRAPNRAPPNDAALSGSGSAALVLIELFATVRRAGSSEQFKSQKSILIGERSLRLFYKMIFFILGRSFRNEF